MWVQAAATQVQGATKNRLQGRVKVRIECIGSGVSYDCVQGRVSVKMRCTS
jgi:hypothetical protein